MSRIIQNHAAFLIATSLMTHAVLAQGGSTNGSYLVEHSFDFQPAGDVVAVTGYEFRHAWIQRTGAAPVYGVEAAMQNPGFDNFGTEGWGTGAGGLPSAFNSGTNGTGVQCVYNSFPILPAGINGGSCLTVDSSPSVAIACTDFFVHPFSATGPYRIQGRISSSGNAHAALHGRGAAFAYAYSSAAINVRGGIRLANGFIQWSPIIMSDIVGGGNGDSALQDPVHFVATNLITGDTIETSLLDFNFDTDGTGIVNWAGGIFETDLDELEFVMDIPPTHVDPGQAGRIELRIENGRVTVANDGGQFAGTLPPVGSSVPLSFALPNDFDLNFDLGLDQTVPWDVTADFSGGGGMNSAFEDPNCPTDINQDGVLDFFDVLLFLELFSEGSPNADFTGEGELDFFDVLGFLDAFAAGCID